MFIVYTRHNPPGQKYALVTQKTIHRLLASPDILRMLKKAGLSDADARYFMREARQLGAADIPEYCYPPEF